jgi:hypothetical protein
LTLVKVRLVRCNTAVSSTCGETQLEAATARALEKKDIERSDISNDG